MDDIELLKIRVAALEHENYQLKELLKRHSINFSHINISASSPAPVTVQNQSEKIILETITQNHCRQFFSYFWGRLDVYSKRYQSKATGKSGYFTQCDNFWRRGICPKASRIKIKCKDCNNRCWTKLDGSQIEKHLNGLKEDASDVIGVYPLFPDGTCRFLVFDFDNHDKGAELVDFANRDESWIGEVDALREICKINNIPMLVERSRSGKGAHLWIFFDKQISAALARRFGFALLEKGAESVNMTSFRFYDRMLPAQDFLEEGELGNLIALPLQGNALKDGNSAFIDENWNAFSDQWRTLLTTRKITQTELQFLLDKWNVFESSEQKFSSTSPIADDIKPWNRSKQFSKEDIFGELHITLANMVYVQANNIKPRMQNQIRRMAALSNPVYFKNNAIGLSNYANSRYIYLGKDDSGYICIPHGLINELIARCKDVGISYAITDERAQGKSINVEFVGILKDNQIKAVNALLKYDNGILSAATAFGKTVVCSNMIAQKKVNTLILLESSALIEQWVNALNNFLSIQETFPEYKTKSGRIKKRKSLIGIIHGAKDTSTGIIDIAMVGSIFKNGEAHPRLKEYGMVIVDECHHSAAETFRKVLREVNAKYLYGVTATPFRGDGLEKINEMLLGPIRFQYTAKEKAVEQGIDHLVVPRFTRTVSPHGRDKLHINEAYEIIRNNELRNKQIANDVKACMEKGRTPVILTRFTDHAEILYELVKNYSNHVVLLTGKKSKKERRELRLQMDAIPPTETLILIATGQLIGEGFDYPRLDTLFMADPIAWKGIVEQYAGRLNRDYDGKKDVIIYDYIDAHIPVFDNMYAKRLRAYKRIGYKLYNGGSSKKQIVNAIFDSVSYCNVYEQDLLEAKKEVVISSPTLSKNKVMRILDILKNRQEAGIRVTVVTWHPDAYRYGRDEHRIELMEELRNVGFNIELTRATCERYAVIDNSIVWYGSINLLSKEDADDNIMRVVSNSIATELLELTFCKGNNLIHYALPLQL